MNRGDCFVAALNNAIAHGYAVVHGTALGTGGDAEGIRYCHAWNESGDYVIDTSNGRPALPLPKALYYRAGTIEDVVVYEPEEAVRLALDAEHYGPWDERFAEVA